jgi:long-chain acyl-CoA synthetase
MSLLITSNLQKHAQNNPAQSALCSGSFSLSYRELYNRVQQRARQIRDLRTQLGEGLGRDPIAILFDNDIAFVEAFLAAIWAGHPAMVFDKDWDTAQLAHAVTTYQPQIILGDANYLSRVDTGYDRARLLPLSVLDEKREGLPLHPEGMQDDIFYIGFTSGTTGQPKAFQRNHKSWVASFNGDKKEFQFSTEDIFLSPGNLVHSLFLYAVITGLFHGASVEMLQQFNVRKVLGLLQSKAVTRIYLVPTMLGTLCEHMDHGDQTLKTSSQKTSGLKTILAGGAKLTPDLQTRCMDIFPTAERVEFFGASETSYITLAKSSENPPPDSVGRTFPGVNIRVQGDGRGQAMPGETGRIYVRSPLMFSGYYRDASNTRFEQSGEWATVGDKGWMDEKGFLYLSGRENRMIISNGRNVFPEEIENQLIQNDAVLYCAVLGLAEDKRGEEICGFVQLHKNATVTANALRQGLAKTLPPYKIPHRFLCVDAMPLTSTNKVAVNTLKAMANKAVEIA